MKVRFILEYEKNITKDDLTMLKEAIEENGDSQMYTEEFMDETPTKIEIIEPKVRWVCPK